MTTLSIWRFGAGDAAEPALDTLEGLQALRLVEIDDVAVVVWPAETHRPRSYQVGAVTGTSELTGAFWGLLFGLLFLVPLAGSTAGPAVLATIGLPEEFLARIRARIVPGTSALFLLAPGESLDPIRSALCPAEFEALIRTLSPEQEETLHYAFGADDRC
jgi:uncharacterized membrane protein